MQLLMSGMLFMHMNRFMSSYVLVYVSEMLNSMHLFTRMFASVYTAQPNTLLILNASAPQRSTVGSEDPPLFSPATLAAAKTPAAPPAAMSISGEVPDEGSDGEEVFIDEQDIIQEIHLDEEGQQFSSSCLAASRLFLPFACSVLTAVLVQISPTMTMMMTMRKTKRWVCGS